MDHGDGECNVKIDHTKAIRTLADFETRYAFGGTDAVIHIAEEMDHPERRVPQAM